MGSLKASKIAAPAIIEMGINLIFLTFMSSEKLSCHEMPIINETSGSIDTWYLGKPYVDPPIKMKKENTGPLQGSIS